MWKYSFACNRDTRRQHFSTIEEEEEEDEDEEEEEEEEEEKFLKFRKVNLKENADTTWIDTINSEYSYKIVCIRIFCLIRVPIDKHRICGQRTYWLVAYTHTCKGGLKRRINFQLSSCIERAYEKKFLYDYF